MCDATVKQYNVLQCPYPDTVFIFGNINTSRTHLFFLSGLQSTLFSTGTFFTLAEIVKQL